MADSEVAGSMTGSKILLPRKSGSKEIPKVACHRPVLELASSHTKGHKEGSPGRGSTYFRKLPLATKVNAHPRVLTFSFNPVDKVQLASCGHPHFTAKGTRIPSHYGERAPKQVGALTPPCQLGVDLQGSISHGDSTKCS